MGEVKKITPPVKVDYEAQYKELKDKYDQAVDFNRQLSAQAKSLYDKLQRADASNFFTRLNFLFKIVEQAPIFPKSVVADTIEEITDAMFKNGEDTDEEDIAETGDVAKTKE